LKYTNLNIIYPAVLKNKRYLNEINLAITIRTSQAHTMVANVKKHEDRNTNEEKYAIMNPLT
jgi:hypothetical protein